MNMLRIQACLHPDPRMRPTPEATVQFLKGECRFETSYRIKFGPVPAHDPLHAIVVAEAAKAGQYQDVGEQSHTKLKLFNLKVKAKRKHKPPPAPVTIPLPVGSAIEYLLDQFEASEEYRRRSPCRRVH